jgi:hypothetical protein
MLIAMATATSRSRVKKSPLRNARAAIPLTVTILSLGLYRPTTLWLERSNNLDLVFGTPGVGAGSFAYVGYEGVVPDGLSPRVEIAFPPRQPGGMPVKANYYLMDRC